MGLSAASGRTGIGDAGATGVERLYYRTPQIQPRDFRTYGLEFDQGYGHLPITLDTPWQGAGKDPWQPFAGEDGFAGQTLLGRGPIGGFIGLAAGRNEYLAGAPCEAYPEVRALWLDWVQAMLDAGVDGIDLRISAHGCLTDEPEAYGWNPPVLAAYAALHGPGTVERSKLAAIRGDFYSDFVREASAMVRARGKKLQIGFHTQPRHRARKTVAEAAGYFVHNEHGAGLPAARGDFRDEVVFRGFRTHRLHYHGSNVVFQPGQSRSERTRKDHRGKRINAPEGRIPAKAAGPRQRRRQAPRATCPGLATD